jgi:hypothetical protein
LKNIIENIAHVQPNQSGRKQQKAVAHDKSESRNLAGCSAPTNLFFYAQKNLRQVHGRSVDVTAAQ